MTDQQPGRLARFLAKLDMDLTDWAALVGLSAFFAGAWLTWSLGVALVILGTVLITAVAAIAWRASSPTKTGR